MQVLKEYGAQIIVFVLIAGAIVGLVVAVGGGDDEEDTNTVVESTNELAEESSLPANETSAPADDVVAAATEETELTSKNGYDASGTATRTIEGDFVHTVEANLPPPPEDKFYEGWLVGNGGFISTGELTNEDGSIWTLVFTSDEDESGRSQVVITEETLANGFDNIPETHVLEGTF